MIRDVPEGEMSASDDANTVESKRTATVNIVKFYLNTESEPT